MTDQNRLENLDADGIAAALSACGNDMSQEQAVAISQFIENIGGIENAMLAVEMLKELEAA